MTHKCVFTLLFITMISISCNRKDLSIFLPSTYFPKEGTGQTIVYLPNTTPENVLSNLITSYKHRNLQEYDSLLAPDYKFYMSLAFQGYFNGNNTMPDPDQWTQEIDSAGKQRVRYYIRREKDLESVRKMFDPAGEVKDIDLSFQAIGYGIVSDTAVYRLNNIELRITLRSNMFYLATDRSGLYITEVTLVRNANGLWQISQWLDGTEGAGDG